MTAEDWQTVAIVFAGVVVAAMALLIVALGCIDDLSEQLKRERSDRRLDELARDMNPEHPAETVLRLRRAIHQPIEKRLPDPSRGPENIA